MQLLVDGRTPLTLGDDATFGETLEALVGLHPDVPAELGDRTSVVLWRDDNRWVQLECDPSRVLREWLAIDVAAVTQVWVYVSERCSHSSPAVRGGYACGRC